MPTVPDKTPGRSRGEGPFGSEAGGKAIMSPEPLLIFHPLTIFLVLSMLWVFGGPALAILLSFVVRTVTNDFMLNPAFRMLSMAPPSEFSNSPDEDPDMALMMRENYLEMCRGIFLIYGVLGLLVIPTFVLILLAEIREPGMRPPAFGLFLTSLLNVLIVGGIMFFSYWLAVVLRDRFCENHTQEENSTAGAEFGSSRSA